MAHFRHRHPDNVPGKFYADILCLDCTGCRDIAPTIFFRDELHNSSFVCKQPETAEELIQCEECVARCPCNAIGDDGDEHDWIAEPRDLSYVESETENAPRGEEARWKFW
jgi:ferredoxin